MILNKESLSIEMKAVEKYFPLEMSCCSKLFKGALSLKTRSKAVGRCSTVDYAEDNMILTSECVDQIF